MSKPIIKFTQEPPIELTCREEREVKLTVLPKAPGVCKVYLSMRLQACTFQDGSDELMVEVECLEGEDSVDCSILVKMKCEMPDEYFTLLTAKAVNSDGDTSFQKAIETNIKCASIEITDSDNPVIS